MLNGEDALPDQVGRESADDGFNFGQLWHCNYCVGGASIKMTNESEWLEYIRTYCECPFWVRDASPLHYRSRSWSRRSVLCSRKPPTLGPRSSPRWKSFSRAITT